MIDISDLKNNRYSRFEIIPWWEQEILKNSRILVIGCGALGNEIVKNLVMSGIGNIFVVDMDNIEISNLTRSVLFRKEDPGKSKAETICRRAREINDGINIKYYDGNIFEIGLGIFREMDIIICGLDNREARLFVNQSCWKVNKPWIDGAIEVLSGVARMFIPPDGACYECTFSEADYKLINKRKSCLLLGIDDIEQGKIPTTPTISSVIAGIQVQEAIKYLHKRKDLSLLSGKGFVFNGNNNDSYIVEYQRREDCQSHYTFDNIKKLNKKFSCTKLNDIHEFGLKYFPDGDFTIEFNNDVVYELINPDENIQIEFFDNLNLLSPDKINIKGKIASPVTFHSLKVNSELFNTLREKNLSELKIPFNDILILSNKDNSKEIQIEFRSDDIFKE